jgi:hypothetical protein
MEESSTVLSRVVAFFNDGDAMKTLHGYPKLPCSRRSV